MTSPHTHPSNPYLQNHRIHSYIPHTGHPPSRNPVQPRPSQHHLPSPSRQSPQTPSIRPVQHILQDLSHPHLQTTTSTLQETHAREESYDNSNSKTVSLKNIASSAAIPARARAQTTNMAACSLVVYVVGKADRFRQQVASWVMRVCPTYG